MLRVKIELVPFGQESKATEIAEILIANTGTTGVNGSNYVFSAMFEGSRWRPEHCVRGVVKNHDRNTHISELVQKISAEISDTLVEKDFDKVINGSCITADDDYVLTRLASHHGKSQLP